MFDEKKHPRDSDGKFSDKSKGDKVQNERKMVEAIRKYSDTPDSDLKSAGIASENLAKLEVFLGEEFKGYKGQAAIYKLLEEKRGHVKAAFHRDDIGDIDLFWGNESVGLMHIIRQRQNEKPLAEEHVNDVLNNIEATLNNGVKRKENGRGDMEFVANGYAVVVAKTYHGNSLTYVLTSYKNAKSKKKAPQ